MADMAKQLAWKDIAEPGAYVELETGRLYRLPHEALFGAAAPGTAGGARSRFVQLSKDPFIFELGARLVCARHNIRPNF